MTIHVETVRTLTADLPHRIEGDEVGVVEYAIQRGDWERGQTH